MNIEIPDDLYERFQKLVEKRPGRSSVSDFVQSLIEVELHKYPAPEYEEADWLTRCRTRNQLTWDVHLAVWDHSKEAIFQNRYLCIDIDDFRSTLDFHGLTAADQVLIELASELRKTYPACNIYRFGGDEFVVELKSLPFTAIKLSLPVRLKHSIVEVTLPAEDGRKHHFTSAILVTLARGMIEARPEGNTLVYQGS